jgi:Calcineurin-like phosphoesterase
MREPGTSPLIIALQAPRYNPESAAAGYAPEIQPHAGAPADKDHPMSSNGFIFANPTYTADNFYQYSAGDIEADSNIQELQATEPIPAPRVNPPVMDLGAVLSADDIAEIQSAGKLVFHSVGDTGGIKQPEPQLAVADAMCADLVSFSGYASGQPAFFFHLGDVVYYFGQQRYYPEQFLDPYRNYDAPIFAIPGNHDGVLYAKEPVAYSLQPFVEYFCTAAPVAAAPSFSRTTMTQPGAYFVLTAPFTRFIGLYSNTGEEMGVIGDNKTIGQNQITFLTNQLSAALAARNASGAAPFALILAVHHPPFTGSSTHFPSAAMLAQIDACCTKAGIWPDLVLSGHAHLYERYTRVMTSGGRQIAYVVAGNGGYYDLSKMTTNTEGEAPAPGVHSEPDGQGNAINLDQWNDSLFGFLRISVSTSEITVVALGVDLGAAADTTPTIIDEFTIDLKAHTVTTTSGSSESA